MRKAVFICVAGKNNIAVNVVSYLLTRHYEAEIGVVCNQTETGVNTWQRSLRLYAQEQGIREYPLDEIYPMDDVVFISLEFDRIVRPERFANARLYNIHFSLLPAYKGMYTSALPILNGEHQSGVTFHRIDSGIDTGEIIAQESFNIDGLTARELYLQYIERGTRLVIANVDSVIRGVERSYPQDADASTYYSRGAIDYANPHIDLHQTACGINNQIMAFNFREYQMPEIDGIPYIDARVTDIRSTDRPGTCIYKNDSEIMLATIDYNIVLFKDRFDRLIKACATGDLATVRNICTVRRHINECEEHGWTPLMVATFHNHRDIVEYLISNGANVRAVNNNGTNLLMYAKDAYKNTGDASLYRLYKRLGLSEETKDYYGNNLYYYLSRDNISLREETL